MFRSSGEYSGRNSANSQSLAIDRTDARILRALQADGRISNLKLAEAKHLFPAAVLERAKRLTRDDFILVKNTTMLPI